MKDIWVYVVVAVTVIFVWVAMMRVAGQRNVALAVARETGERVTACEEREKSRAQVDELNRALEAWIDAGADPLQGHDQAARDMERLMNSGF